MSNDPEELRKRIAQLEKQLEEESLKREAYELLIEIAKRDFGIDVGQTLATKHPKK